MFFWNSLAFSMIQWMLAIWSLVPLPFLKPAWTSGSSRFMYCWSLDWRIGATGGKESAGQCRRHKRCRFNLWVRNIPWSRKWQPIPVFLPGKNSMGRGAWQATVHGVATSQTQLSTCQQQQHVQFYSICHLCTLYNQDMKLLHYHKKPPSCYILVFTNLPPLLTPRTYPWFLVTTNLFFISIVLSFQ